MLEELLKGCWRWFDEFDKDSSELNLDAIVALVSRLRYGFWRRKFTYIIDEFVCAFSCLVCFVFHSIFNSGAYESASSASTLLPYLLILEPRIATCLALTISETGF